MNAVASFASRLVRLCAVLLLPRLSVLCLTALLLLSLTSPFFVQPQLFALVVVAYVGTSSAVEIFECDPEVGGVAVCNVCTHTNNTVNGDANWIEADRICEKCRAATTSCRTNWFTNAPDCYSTGVQTTDGAVIRYSCGSMYVAFDRATTSDLSRCVYVCALFPCSSITPAFAATIGTVCPALTAALAFYLKRRLCSKTITVVVEDKRRDTDVALAKV
jgi:hypothetical protein